MKEGLLLRWQVATISLLVGLFVGSSFAQNAVVSWVNPHGGSFGNAVNWNTSKVPGPTDTVYIGVPSNSSGIFNINLNGATFSIGTLYFMIPVPSISTYNVQIVGPGSLIIGDFYCGGSVSNSAIVNVTHDFIVPASNSSALRKTKCTLDQDISLILESGSTAHVSGGIMLGRRVTIVNRGHFYIQGPGIEGKNYSFPAPDNNFINQNILSVMAVAGTELVMVYPNLLNSGIFIIPDGTVLIFGIVSNSGSFTVGDSASMSISGGTFTQTAGITIIRSPSVTVNAQSDDGIGNLTLSGGSVLLSPVAYAEETNLAAHVYNNGGVFSINTTAAQISLAGSYNQGPQGTTTIIYEATNQLLPALVVSNGEESGSETVCDATGTLDFQYFDSKQVYPTFKLRFPVIQCDSYEYNTSSLNYDTVKVSQPNVGSVLVTRDSFQVNATLLYNISLTMNRFQSGNAVTYIYSTVIAENLVPLSDIKIGLEISNSAAQVQLPTKQLITNAGIAQLVLNIPQENVNSVLEAKIIGCVNVGVSCSLSATITFQVDDDESWFDTHWWVLLIILGILGVVVVIGGALAYTIWRRKRVFSRYERLLN